MRGRSSNHGSNCDHRRLGHNAKEQHSPSHSDNRTNKLADESTSPEACLNVNVQLNPMAQRQDQQDAMAAQDETRAHPTPPVDLERRSQLWCHVRAASCSPGKSDRPAAKPPQTYHRQTGTSDQRKRAARSSSQDTVLPVQSRQLPTYRTFGGRPASMQTRRRGRASNDAAPTAGRVPVVHPPAANDNNRPAAASLQPARKRQPQRATRQDT